VVRTAAAPHDEAGGTAQMTQPGVISEAPCLYIGCPLVDRILSISASRESVNARITSSRLHGDEFSRGCGGPRCELPKGQDCGDRLHVVGRALPWEPKAGDSRRPAES